MTIYATDKNGLVAQMSLCLSIIDQEKPIIIFRSQPLPIPVFSNESDINFLSYILSVDDNYSDLLIEDVSYTHDIEFDILAKYTEQLLLKRNV